jgi:hypothetical protein
MVPTKYLKFVYIDDYKSRFTVAKTYPTPRATAQKKKSKMGFHSAMVFGLQVLKQIQTVFLTLDLDWC